MPTYKQRTSQFRTRWHVFTPPNASTVLRSAVMLIGLFSFSSKPAPNPPLPANTTEVCVSKQARSRQAQLPGRAQGGSLDADICDVIAERIERPAIEIEVMRVLALHERTR